MTNVEFSFSAGSAEPTGVVYRKPGHERCYLWQPCPQHRPDATQQSTADAVNSLDPFYVSVRPPRGEPRQGLLVLVPNEGTQQPLQQAVGDAERRTVSSPFPQRVCQPSPVGHLPAKTCRRPHARGFRSCLRPLRAPPYAQGTKPSNRASPRPAAGQRPGASGSRPRGSRPASAAGADVQVSAVPSTSAKPDTSSAPASPSTATQSEPPAASTPHSSMQQAHVASAHGEAGREVSHSPIQAREHPRQKDLSWHRRAWCCHPGCFRLGFRAVCLGNKGGNRVVHVHFVLRVRSLW